MDDDWFPRHPLLRPGVRVVRRDDGHQVGRWPDERVLLPRDPAAATFLADLAAGRRPDVSAPGPRRWATQLVERGLLVGEHDRARRLAREEARVAVSAPAGWWTEDTARLLDEAGLRRTTAREVPVATLALSPTGDLTRTSVDGWMRSGEPHLVVSQVAGRVTIGPFVVPGLTACLRCVDAHGSDRDPGHGLVLEQHGPDPAEPTDPVLLRLALAWAVRDLVAYVEGDLPSTWSATTLVDGALRPEHTRWQRHPRCGCSWGDNLATA